jgi:Xaa-Pro aminopeptidase
MIHSLEPGIYLHQEGGIRIEDDALVILAGVEILGPIGVILDGLRKRP